MKRYSIAPDYFNDTYMINYLPGCMGEFLSSLIVHSFTKKILYRKDSPGVDWYFYHPWNKKWVVLDSSSNRVRDFLYRKLECLKNSGPDSYPRLASDFELPIDCFDTENELSTVMVDLTAPNKKSIVPFIFVNEEFGNTYGRFQQVPNQLLPGINLIEAEFFNPKFKFLGFLLKIYKNNVYNSFYKNPYHDNKEFFISHGMNYYENPDEFRSLREKITGIGSYYKIDTLKLILEKDNQGLDLIQTDDIFIDNMIDVAKHDIFKILDFFNFDINNLPVPDEKLLSDMYDKLMGSISK